MSIPFNAYSILRSTHLHLVLVFVFCLPFSACEDDPEPTGSVEITVTFQDEPAFGATVTTAPEGSDTLRRTTDRNGLVRFRDIPVGRTVFDATFDGAGDASIDVTVREHPIERFFIGLEQPEGLPFIEDFFIFNSFFDQGSVGDTLEVEARIFDEDQRPSLAWDFRIVSSLDGVVFTDQNSRPAHIFRSSYTLEATFTLPSPGVHLLVAIATDTDGHTATSEPLTFSVLPPQGPPILTSVLSSPEGPVITWEDPSGGADQIYELRRRYLDNSEVESFFIFADEGLTFTDVYANPARPAAYSIIKSASPGDLATEEVLAEYDYDLINVGGRIGAFAADLERPLLYVLRPELQSLVSVDLTNGRLRDSVAFDRPPAVIHYAAITDLVYVMEAGDRTVRAFNPVDLNPAEEASIQVPAEIEVNFSTSLAVTKNGDFLYTAGSPGLIYLLNGRTGAVLDSAPLGEEPFVTYDRVNDKAYVASDNFHSTSIQRFGFEEGRLVEEASAVAPWAISRPRVQVPEDSEFVYYGNAKYSRPDLINVGVTVDSEIQAVSSDEALAVTRAGLFRTNDRGLVRGYPDFLLDRALYSESQGLFVLSFLDATHLVVLEP